MQARRRCAHRPEAHPGVGTLEPRRMMLVRRPQHSAQRAARSAQGQGGNPCNRHPKDGKPARDIPSRDAIATGASDAERTRAASPCPARIVTRLKLETDLLSRARVGDSGTACIHYPVMLSYNFAQVPAFRPNRPHFTPVTTARKPFSLLNTEYFHARNDMLQVTSHKLL
jgi:hypothetical protein